MVSLDGKNITESDRLIFTYLTRENNLGMKNSLDNVISAGAGNGPITLLNGIVKAEIKLDSNKKYAVYPLSLTGERREKIPFEFKDGCMILQIDNSKLKYGSTAFFEIAVQ